MEQKPILLKPALIGGVTFGVLSGLPIIEIANCACCALAIGGGVLSAFLYSKNLTPSSDPPFGAGAGLGALTGAIGAVVSSIVKLPFILLGVGAAGLAGITEALEGIEGVPPEMVDVLSGVGAAGVGFLAILIGLIFSLVLYTIFAMIGSLIGIFLFARK